MEISYTKGKPDKWPANLREFELDRLGDALDDFKADPNYITRERIVALVTKHDLNDSTGFGEMRVTEYEVGLINSIYLMAKTYQLNSVVTFLYDIIGQTTRLQKNMAWMSPVIGDGSQYDYAIPVYESGLFLSLRLYYFAYQKYTVEKTETLAIQLIDVVKQIISAVDDNEEGIDSICYAYSALLLDISNMHGTKREKLWEFDRKELSALLALEAELFKKNNQKVNIRPVKGILMMQISNFILKSRNDYNNDYICKYVSSTVARDSIKNKEIWMRKTELLNDEREQKVVPELFDEVSWIDENWVKDIDFTPVRTYYVSSFSKNSNNDDMQNEYGECIYGYKNDRIIDLIAPIGIYHLKKKDGASDDMPDKIDRPYISQVLAFDVIYDREEAKQELKYLIKVINLFDLEDEAKKKFLEEILQYWILSVKDAKWKDEKERRYVLFLYEGYDYKEIIIEDDFLKEKTSLFIMPDFIKGKHNPARYEIMRQLIAKRKVLSNRDYLLCNNCLSQDFDAIVMKQTKKCSICGSEDVSVINIE